MAVSSKGRARGMQLLLQSVTLVDLNYPDCGPVTEIIAAAPEAADADASASALCQAMSIGLPAQPAAADLAPRYDPRLRQLWLGGFLLKTISKPRTNQAIILAAFEEEDWPELIDDPLPRDAETMPSKRLHDTLFALNRAILAQSDRRAQYLLEFHARDGGEAIRRRTIGAPARGKARLPLTVWRPAVASGIVQHRPRHCK